MIRRVKTKHKVSCLYQIFERNINDFMIWLLIDVNFSQLMTEQQLTNTVAM